MVPDQFEQVEFPSESPRPIVGLYAVAEEVYCPRSAYYHQVEAEPQLEYSHEFVASVLDHEIIHRRDTRRKTARWWQATGGSLFHEKLGLVGSVDCVEHREGRIIPVEHKPGAPPLRPWHKLQVVLQALCLEEMTGRPVQEGAVFYRGTRRRVVFPIHPDDRKEAEGRVHAFRRKLRESGMTAFSRVNDTRCPKCTFVEICMPSCLFREPKAV